MYYVVWLCQVQVNSVSYSNEGKAGHAKVFAALGVFNAELWPHHKSVYGLFILLSLLSDIFLLIFHRKKKECRKFASF